MPTAARTVTLADAPAFLRARGRLLGWIAVVALLVASLFGWELRQSFRDARLDSQRDAKNLALLLKEQLEGAFRETDLVLRDLAGRVSPAQLSQLDSLLPAQRSSLFNLFDGKRATLPQAEMVGLVSSDGLWAMADGKRTLADPILRDLFAQLSDNPGQEMVLSRPVRLRGNNELGFVMARRIASDNGKLAGLVYALVRLEYYSQLARRLDAAENSTFNLIDNDIVLVARYPEQPARIGLTLPLADRISEWVNGRSSGYTVFTSPTDGLLRGYHFERLEGFPFILLIGLPDQNYFGDWWRKASAYLAAFVMLILFAVAMAWRGWRENQLTLAVELGAARLQEQDAHILRALDAMSRPILLVRADSDMILAANHAAGELVGKPAAALVGQPLPSLYVRPEHHDKIVEQLVERQAVTDYELKFRAANGEPLWVGLSGSVIQYQNGRAYFLSLMDISERKAAHETLWRKATIDPLTGVANRGYFLERAEQEWHRARRYGHKLGMLMLDIDYFKQVNDTYGHDVGDQVLQGFVSVVKRKLRDSDLFGRLGGEEFGIVLMEYDRSTLTATAERLRAALAEQPLVLADGQILNITVSIGCTLASSHDLPLAVLMKQADQALYAAKHGGRNSVIYYDPASPAFQAG
ncbi:diguanylate cyclase [Chitinimonas sp. BJYL2]|uniref:sensor domain-containing diguanylate cyclase n=1 Tax=Chitinimonas sp. BJYL2 TaxID=2976696 RepID=UPI0022B53F25|nr:diguanylate cyclase [Chitinimonas sp. BJYL2]